jgi:hypothetical protein
VKKLHIILLLLLYANVHCIFSLEDETEDLTESAPIESGPTVKGALIGSAEMLFTQGVVMAYNVAVQASYAKPTADSIRANLKAPWNWTWESDDGFVINQVMHPLQGLFYHSAGRVNGFDFYQSASFNIVGSAIWELFCEDHPASLNDTITTVFSSMTMGEIMYLLYLEACAAGAPAPLAFLVNPMAGLHRLITGWKPPNYGRNLYQLRAHLGGGYAGNRFTLPEPEFNMELNSYRGHVIDAGIKIVYGDPFTQESRKPFNHFDFFLHLGMIDLKSFMSIRFVSDGYLFSFLPVYTDTDMMSTGLSLHLDVVVLGRANWGAIASDINLYSNALDWTIKYQHLFSENAAFQVKFHTGVTFMGVSAYHSMEEDRGINNFGAGLNSKLIFGFDHKKLGNLEISAFGYILWTFPRIIAISKGTAYWLFTDITYSHLITRHLSAGITHSFAFERGFFKPDEYPDVRKWNNAVKLFLAWNL